MQGLRILIAEDDATSRVKLTAVLKKLGHEVVATSDGEQAWEAMQKADAPRLLILDWKMPHLDGVEVCRRLREVETDRPAYILMLTALNEKQHVIEGLDAGANDYATKPIEPTELRARIAAGRRILVMQDRLVAQADELRKALSQVKTLRGFIPICCHCKRVRGDKDYWRDVEEYVSAHTDALFSHGLCPDCLAKHYPE